MGEEGGKLVVLQLFCAESADPLLDLHLVRVSRHLHRSALAKLNPDPVQKAQSH